MAEVQISFWDYDNLAPSKRLSQVVEEGGADEADAINEHGDNFTARSRLDASGLGWVGDTRGWTPSCGSGGPNDQEGYKGGGDSSSLNAKSDSDSARASIEATSEADVRENEMGNDLFSARTASVSDACAAGNHGSGNKISAVYKVRSSTSDTVTRITDNTLNTLHTGNCSSETTRLTSPVVSTQPEPRRSKQPSDTIVYNVNDIGLNPSKAELHEENQCISKFADRKILDQDCINSFSNKGENVNHNTELKIANDTSEGSSVSFILKVENGGSYLENTCEVKGQKLEHIQVTKGHVYHVSSNDSLAGSPSTCSFSPCVSSADSQTIITRVIPDTTSQTSTYIDRFASGTVENSQTRPKIKDSGIRQSKQEVEDAAQTKEMKRSNSQNTKFKKSGLVGGVRVLPSTFQFNFRRFRETEKDQSKTESATSSNKVASPTSPGLKQAEVNTITSTNVASSNLTKDIQEITLSHPNKDDTNSIITSIKTTSTETTALSSGGNSSGNVPVDMVGIHGISTYDQQRYEDICNDYAVPSDLGLGLESSQGGRTSNTKDFIDNAHTNTGSTFLDNGMLEKSTSSIVGKNKPDTEDIYAIPIPKSERLASSPKSDGTREVAVEVHTAQLPPPSVPQRSPLSNIEPSLDGDDDDAFDDVVMRKPAQASSQMKKSTTTGMLHSYSGDYSNIPKTGSRKYDYFSLGRRPKRPRIRTLIDSQGMTVSLDMLLRSRRQSSLDLNSSPETEQALSVDDILKSCLEFDETSSTLYRTGSTGTRIRLSSKCPLTFRDVKNVTFPSSNSSTKEKQTSKDVQGLSKNTRKGKTSSKKTENIKMTESNLKSDSVQKITSDNTAHSKEDETVYLLKKNGSVKDKHSESLERKQKLTAADVDKDKKPEALLHDPKVKMPEANPSEYSHTTSAQKLDNVKSYIASEAEGINTNEARTMSILPADTDRDENSKKHKGHIKHDSDYDSIDDNSVSKISPSRVTFSSSEVIKNGAVVEKCSSPLVDNKDVTHSGSEKPGNGTAMSRHQPKTVLSEKQKEEALFKPTTKVSTLDTSPHSTTSFSTSSQIIGVSQSTGITLSNQPILFFKGDHISQGNNFRDLSPTSPDTPSPLSLSTSSDSASVSSPGVMSSLSVEVAEGHHGNSSSPKQKSPNVNAKLEAAEAIKWLRAAGFPQYAQMFEDGQFPVDMGVVEKDHDFLDKDSLQSLFRRLLTLNKYTGTKLGAHPTKKATGEEEEDDDFCALSERWEYQKSARRWSRKDLSPSSVKSTASESDTRELAGRSGSHDSLLADQDSGSQTGDSPLLDSKMPHQNVVHPQGQHEMASLSVEGHPVAEITQENYDQTDFAISPRLRRAATEKIKTAKNIFKKMEGFKSSKSRRHHHHNRNIVEISGPFVADKESMQAKLDRLNCVDISPSSDSSTSSPATLVRRLDNSKLKSSSSAAGTPNTSSSPQSPPPASSPRPHSDLMLRPRESSHQHVSSTTHTGSSHGHQNQHSSLSHDSSFEEYYQAQNMFFRNLQSSQDGTTEGTRRNNSETNLMEIFLVPQDHQPGRFPRMLQNGYIETEACGTAVNVRTGSVRLGRGTALTSDTTGAGSRVAHTPNGRGFGYRVSVYDNFLPSEGKRQDESATPSAIPGITELKLPASGSEAVPSISRDSSQPRNEKLNLDSNQLGITDTSRDGSEGILTESASDQENRSSTRDRSVESTSSSQTPQKDSPATEPGFSSTESRCSRKSSPDSISSKSRVAHSSSVDSYFRGSSSHSDTSASENTETTAAVAFQQDYDEFDRILQELYRNINDLTSIMDKDKSEKTPKLVRAATSPLPASSNNSQTPLHVALPSSRPVLRSQRPVVDPSSPSSATSDLVPSPASPSSPQDPNESFYRALELDNENSSSGGEGSNTAESSGEDQEAVFTDVSHDDSLDQVIEVSRERRDSGVGHSLTRAPSDRRRKKIRWHSFQKSHRPDVTSRAMQINSLTVGQLVRLQKHSLLKLTGIMEKHLPVNKSGWNWMVTRFMKRQKTPDFSDKSVFGVPLSVMAQRTGQPLPQCVLYAMRYLRRTCQSAVGIFRKSGVKSKIQQLRDHLEAHPDMTNFEGENAYNVADMLKTYFRDLPECLLTNKMSETFRSIYTYVPTSQRLEAIQAAILLLPDENREVLQSILLFLSDIASHEADHQMNASNLAVCFTPTVFHLGPRQSVPYSPKRNRKNSSGVPDPREILEQKAAHECLLMMITECKKLFTVPSHLFRQLQVQSSAHMEPTLPQDIGNSPADVRAFGQERIQMVLKEAHDKNREWIPTMTVGDVEVFYRKPMDDCPLKEWKFIVEIEAPPIEVLRRIMHERHTWDEDLLSWSVVERLDPYSDVFQFVLNSMAPHPPRNFCVLRYWRSDLTKGACALITKSVEHPDVLEIQGVWAIDWGTYFLMEPCGSGRSRLMYITRVDTRGRMPEWYLKIFGHILANFLERLKESFKQDTSGPETKV